jgi:hypothetical protein
MNNKKIRRNMKLTKELKTPIKKLSKKELKQKCAFLKKMTINNLINHYKEEIVRLKRVIIDVDQYYSEC